MDYKVFIMKSWSKMRTTSVGIFLTKNRLTLLILNFVYKKITDSTERIYDTGDYKIIIDPRDIGIGRRYLIDGEHEIVAKSYVNKLKFDIFIEVGSNIGDWPLFLSSMKKNLSKHILFEPVPKYAERLKENLALNSIENYEFFDIALSDRRSKSKIYLDSENHGNNSINENCVSNFDTVLNVQTDRLENLISDYNLSSAMLKIDAQGHEQQILKGSRGVLPKIKYLMIETTKAEWSVLIEGDWIDIIEIIKIAIINELSHDIIVVTSLDEVGAHLNADHYYDLVFHLDGAKLDGSDKIDNKK